MYYNASVEVVNAVVIGFDPGHETSYLSAEWHDFNFIPGGEM
jgi:hypothetical protein